MAEGSSNVVSNKAWIVDCIEGNSALCSRLLKELTGKDITPDEDSVSWSVDNRYYSADIDIAKYSLKDFGRDRDDNCEAIILLYSAHELDTFPLIKSLWEAVCDDLSPSVCLLVEACLTDKEEDADVLKWCVEYGFELVVWKYQNEAITSNEDSLDKQGVARICDALQAHMWPSMTMKNKKDDNVSSGQSTVPVDPSPSSTNGTSTTVTNGVNELTPEQLLSRGLGNHGDPDGDDPGNITGKESFEELFGRFSDMKAHADSLPHEERKDYAEKVVMAFWEAIGGDEDELKDI